MTAHIGQVPGARSGRLKSPLQVGRSFFAQDHHARILPIDDRASIKIPATWARRVRSQAILA
ncbi:hypothetical protein [uncultured Lamprocystis sp.]|uniref:hypothetical protein n=1 Tax=uncultured Lamprocystis sp. TaxID=543132 RepID=UPI0025E8D478|nr:hypothetical protein [uncultured Lamprocystis sp.]